MECPHCHERLEYVLRYEKVFAAYKVYLSSQREEREEREESHDVPGDIVEFVCPSCGETLPDELVLSVMGCD